MGCLSCAGDDLREKKAIVVLFCLITAPDCRSDASVWMLQRKARLTLSAINCSMALKTETSSGARCDLPFAHPESAVSGATMLGQPFQRDCQKLTIPMKDQSLAMALGKSMSRMGLILSGFGRTPVEVMTWPSHEASNLHQWHSEASVEKTCWSN